VEIFDHIITCANIRSLFQSFEVDQAFSLNEVEVFFAVQVFLFWARVEVQVEIRPIVLIVVILWQIVRNFCVQTDCSLVSPASSHVLNAVAATAEHHQWQIPTLDELNTL